MSASPASTGSSSAPSCDGVVLAVAVDAHRELEAVLERVAEAGLDRAADPEVERQPDDVRAALLGDGGGAVDRAVVDDDDLEPGSKARISSITRAIALLLVQRGDDRDAPDRRPARVERHGRGLGDLSHGPPPERPARAASSSLPRAVEVGVLVERALAGGAAHLLRLRPGSSSSSW